MVRSTRPENHANKRFSSFHNVEAKSYQSKMKQNNSTELSSNSFLKVYNKCPPPDPNSVFFPAFLMVFGLFWARVRPLRLLWVQTFWRLRWVVAWEGGPQSTFPKKCRSPIQNLNKIQKNTYLGSGEVWWAIFTVNIIRRLTQKLRRIILLQFVTFRIHLRKDRKKTHHFHDFRISGRAHDSQNQYSLSVETPRYSKYFKKKRILFGKQYVEKFYFGNSEF